MSTEFDDFARATLGGARNAADGAPLRSDQVDRIIDYLRSPGSGALPGQSFEEWMERRMAEHPPRLGAGMQYVAYSGIDQGGVSNGANARGFVATNPSSAGTIGETPWGRFIESDAAKVDLNRIADGLGRQLAAEGVRPFNGNPLGAAQDMMWNAGSPEFARNAMQSGRPLIAFVDGAPVGRGFSTFELPVVREYPEGSINGRRVAALGDDAVALDNARQSAVTYARMEQSVATSLGLDPDNPAHIERMRFRLDLARGFDAQAGTVFGERFGALSARDLDSFGLVADEWSARNAGLSASALRPGPSLTGRVAAGATILGAALTAAEGNEAIQRSGALYDMGNATGARSELIHFGSRSVGAWGGAALGAGGGAALTSWSGPGAVIGGIVGGAAGLVGGQYVADVLDHRSIYRQQDAQGYTYTFDPENPTLGWRRTETVDQVAANGRMVEQRREVVASDALASQLDRQATTVSLELMLARPPVPRDPYTLPAAPGDAVSAQPFNWQRDPASGEWRRNIYEWRTDTIDPGFTTLGEVVTADPARAAQLEAQPQAILRENVHLAPAAMAARYELASHDRGWTQASGLPESARHALRDDGRLVASDGAEYQRQVDGRWERQALFGLTTADANPRIAAELDATRGLLQEGLREHRAMMAERPQPVPPTFEESMAGSVARAYARQGLQPSAESIETMGRAMAADYRARGIDAPFLLQLERDPATNQHGPDSPMGLYTRGVDGGMALRFTMTPSEAREVLAAPSPEPASPALAPSRAEVAPRDPLFDAIRGHVQAMDRSMGRTPDEASDRVAAALTAEWRANGLATPPDGVVLGQKGTAAQPGEYVFAYAGSSERPSDWVGVKTAEAVQTPVEQSLAQAETLQRQQAMEAQQVAQQPANGAPAREIG